MAAATTPTIMEGVRAAVGALFPRPPPGVAVLSSMTSPEAGASMPDSASLMIGITALYVLGATCLGRNALSNLDARFRPAQLLEQEDKGLVGTPCRVQQSHFAGSVRRNVGVRGPGVEYGLVSPTPSLPCTQRVRLTFARSMSWLARPSRTAFIMNI